MTNWTYLSHPWGPSCPAYAGGKRIALSSVASMAKGAHSNTLEFNAVNHAGTHFDFPLHFDPKGRDVLDYPPESFIHEKVALIWLDVPRAGLVSTAMLKESLKSFAGDFNETLVLIRTGAATYRQTDEYWRQGPGLDVGTGDFLREKFPKLTTIGLDAISISSLPSREKGRIVHREILAGVRPLLIIEDMNLEPLAGKPPHQVVALPLRIEGGDGAPCTIVARC